MIPKTDVKHFFEKSFDFPSIFQEINHLSVKRFFKPCHSSRINLHNQQNGRLLPLPHFGYRLINLLNPLSKISGFVSSSLSCPFNSSLKSN